MPFMKTEASLLARRSARNFLSRDLASWISKHWPDLNLRDLAPHLNSLTLAATELNGALNAYGMRQFPELFDMWANSLSGWGAYRTRSHSTI